MADAVVQKAVEEARKKLLDTSRRNRLINCKPSKTSGAEIVGESPDFVFQTLVGDGKKLEFRGKPDPKEPQDPMTELDDLPPSEPQAAATPNPNDRLLDCAETKSRLSKKLLKTFRDQRTLLEETGVNTLFLALGAVVWQDTDAKQSERRSPLILLPVSLIRKAGGDVYEVEWDGSDPIPNLSVGALLRDEFGLRLPELPSGEEVVPSDFFSKVEMSLSSKNWTVDQSFMVLGFFSSAKYLMFADLDPTRWPQGQAPNAHDILTTILNPDSEDLLDDDGLGFAEDQMVDPHRRITECHEVVDCDGSQLLAIMQAAKGASMVIEGPPGTGKSQTITNLLADAVARGKRVLFVAEKLAALNVVARNLERVGLRHLCLELHSHYTNKAEFYRDLAISLGSTVPSPPGAELQEELQRVRDSLNQYPVVVNQTVSQFGVTPREAIGEILGLGPDQTGRVRIQPTEADALDRKRLGELLETLEPAQTWARNNGHPGDHPFRALDSDLDPVGQSRLLDCLADLETVLEALREQAQSGAATLGVPPPDGRTETASILSALQACRERPDLNGVVLDPLVIDQNAARIGPALRAARGWAAAHREVGSKIVEADWAQVGMVQPEDIAVLRSGLFRFFNHKYRALKALAVRCDPGAGNDEARAALLHRLVEAHRQREQLRAELSSLQAVFTLASDDPALPWEEWEAVWNWIQNARTGAREGLLPADFPASASGVDRTAADQAARALEEAVRTFDGSEQTVREFGLEIGARGFDATLTSIREMLIARDRLDSWCKWRNMVQRLQAAGLEHLLALALKARKVDRLGEILARSFYERALQTAYLHPVLREFSIEDHQAKLRRFRDLDRRLLEFNRKKIVALHAQSLPRGHAGVGGVGKIQKEAQKQRRHQSIRKTMEEAHLVIQKVKPIFMMSPVSVAMYLPQDGPRFDVVIFDEASQIRPEEAMGAVARGSQVIVVGDTKQMPPTSFFERMTSDETDEEEVEEATAGLESILDLIGTKIRPGSPTRRDLRWHYRSRHASLITPSNGLFYDWRLFIVPNPAPPDRRLGLVFHQLTDAHYERGGSRTNKGEAKAVVEAIIRNLEAHPEESMMAVAFSQAQQQAIQDELDQALKGRPDLSAKYAELHPTEPLDVKNLENVQGDERDVVLISVGYGRTIEGYLSQSFGPLNQEGGWRRLNVLITRSRLRCEVFTNLSPEDIRSEGRGPTALRAFLSYAQSGHMDVPEATGREPMSVFEEQVIRAIEREGYRCEPQVGVAGFFIDIGVRHPDQPERFCLGIECDGAQYHRSTTARDRDRLRQAVLESRGWRIARVWSTDWFANQEAATKRLIEEIRNAVAGEPHEQETWQASAGPPPLILEVPPAPVAPALAATPPRAQPYEIASVSSLPGWDAEVMMPFVLKPRIEAVVQVEAPIHLDEVIRRIREATGGGRSGRLIKEAFERCAGQAAPSGITFDGQWYVPTSIRPPRDRSQLASAFKNHALIHDIEIQAAMSAILKAELVVPAKSLVKEAFAFLGITRVSSDAMERGERLLAEAKQRGWIEETSGGLAIAEPQR